MTIYTTYFDTTYLVRGLACIESLLLRGEEAPRILVLALDAACAQALAKLAPKFGLGGRLEILSLEELEAKYPLLLDAKRQRSVIEYYFTLTPFLCAEALERAADGEYAVYLDADLYFFSDPAAALEAAHHAPVAIVPHRFPGPLAHLATLYGEFNVGWIALSPSDEARDCLTKWQARCLESCLDAPENGRFGDQKYLDAWPREFPSLAIVDHPGVNLAPWNIARHALSRDQQGKVAVDGYDLVFFHFHRLDRLEPSLYDVDLRSFGRFDKILSDDIYVPYLRTLDRIEAIARGEVGWAPRTGAARYARSEFGYARRLLGRLLRALRLLLRRRAIFRYGQKLSIWKGLRFA